jgi:1-acyl-sn-glycerol-3-phosphate acyltransferase
MGIAEDQLEQSHLMAILRALAFHTGFFLGTAVLAIAGLPTLLAPPRWARWMGSIWGRFVLTWARLTTGITYRIEGTLPTSPVIFACKHQSAFETYLFPMICPNALFVLKQELLRVPLVGWYLNRSGQIAIDRKAGASAIRKLLVEARSRVRDGHSLTIFPEGTRVAPGASVPLQPGVRALYGSLGLPVVPVSLNSGVYWPRNSFLRRPGCVRVIIHPPIPPGLSRSDFEKALEETMLKPVQPAEEGMS